MSADMSMIIRCVICERRLKPDRAHVDTCNEKCFKALLRRQRAKAGL